MLTCPSPVVFLDISTKGVLELAGLDALCYVVLLLMPVLGRMSDQQEDIRRMASQCFATLVTLMPLEVEYSNEVLCDMIVKLRLILYISLVKRRVM